MVVLVLVVNCLLKSMLLLPLAMSNNVMGNHKKDPQDLSNLPIAKITKVRAILTAPYKTNLVIVKVETDQAGLYGVGCATFTQRAQTVASAITDYLNDFCKGKNAANIEDIWQTAYVSSYWRNGPILNNVLSGLDQALWDIKGKMAGMPVYKLLGGKTRFAVDTYTHASGKTAEDAMDNVKKYREMGFRNMRIQLLSILFYLSCLISKSRYKFLSI